VALRQRRMGAVGEEEPKAERMVACSFWNDLWAAVSAAKLRVTFTSTIEPEEMSAVERD